MPKLYDKKIILLFISSKKMFFENEERINEVQIKNSSFEKVDFINVLSKSICKIETDNTWSSGFLMKLIKGGKECFFLITNEHAINKEMILSNKKIKFLYDKNKLVELELNKNGRFIRTYDYMNIDACLIQILQSDNIDESYFLPTPKIDDLNKYEKLKNKKICILQFPKGGVLQKSNNKIIDVDLYKYELYYNAETDFGSSGSPIFLANTKEVIGIHKQKYIHTGYNIGNFLIPIIESLRNDRQYVEKFIIKGNEIYEGEINRNNMREGFGKIIYKNGCYYIGKWLNDKKYGIGVEYNDRNMIIYKGEFANNEYDGEGTYYEKGKKYKGHWENNKKNGKGEEYDSNNIKRYDGEFKNNKYSGFGSYFYEDGKLEYDGRWENNKRNGKGIEYYKNGNEKIKYDGEFIDDVYHGKGIYLDKNQKLLYDGEWKNGKRNGSGKDYYKDNKLKYVGEFIDDAYHGKGTSFYENGNIEYDGMWKNGKRNGEGKQFYENNNRKYFGNFENDEYNGIGESYDQNGKIEYNGEWKGGKKNGKGKKYYKNEPNKLEYKGDFIDNDFNGDGKSYYKNGNVEYDGQWKNNKKHGVGVEFWDFGNIKAKGSFKNGRLDDGEDSELKNDKIIKITIHAGKLVEKSKCF